MIKDYRLLVRCPKELKENFSLFCDSCGMNMTDAINLFVVKMIEEENIPFTISATDMKGVRNFGSFEERYNFRIAKENKEKFAEICQNIGFPMGKVIKMFMIRCLHEGKLPF